MTSRLVSRDLKIEVMVKRPSRVSNVRVFLGVSMSEQTSVRRVADWIAGQLTGSRRSRRCCAKLVSYHACHFGQSANVIDRMDTYIHV